MNLISNTNNFNTVLRNWKVWQVKGLTSLQNFGKENFGQWTDSNNNNNGKIMPDSPNDSPYRNSHQ